MADREVEPRWCVDLVLEPEPGCEVADPVVAVAEVVADGLLRLGAIARHELAATLPRHQHDEDHEGDRSRQDPRETARRVTENAPEITAWDAIIVAEVARDDQMPSEMKQPRGSGSRERGSTVRPLL